MADDRIQIKLYEAATDDAEIIAWIKQLPRDTLGKRKIKEHVVRLLAKAIRGESKKARRATTRKANNANTGKKTTTGSRQPNRSRTPRSPAVRGGSEVKMTAKSAPNTNGQQTVEAGQDNPVGPAQKPGSLPDSFVLDDLLID